MDLLPEHYRAYVFLELQRGKKPCDIYRQLQETHVADIPSQRTIYLWCEQFATESRHSLHDAPRSGRPSTSSSDASIAAVRELVFQFPRLSTRQMSLLLNLPRTSVNRILKEELLLSKVCSVWIPHVLSDSNKADRMAGAKELKRFFDNHSEEDLLRLYVTEDETWVLFHGINTKEENKVWLPPGQHRPQVPHQGLTWEKTMILVAFTCNKKFSVEATERGETVNADYYKCFINKTGEKWRKLRSDPVRLSDVWWQQDNARPHLASTTQEFFQQRGICQIKQPPYSPDMNLCDRFLFKLLKKELRKCDYSIADEVKTASLQVLRAIPEDRFTQELRKLREHCVAVIHAAGNYVTK